MHVCLSICVCICMLAHTETQGGQKLLLAVLSNFFTWFFWARVSRWSQNSSFWVDQAAEVTVYTATPESVLLGDPTWGPSSRCTSTPPTKLSHHKHFVLQKKTPAFFSFFKKKLVIWEFHTMSFNHIYPSPCSSKIYPPSLPIQLYVLLFLPPPPIRSGLCCLCVAFHWVWSTYQGQYSLFFMILKV